MNTALFNLQHVPENLNPIAASIGFFSVSWYALMYLAGFATVFWLLSWRVGKGEGRFTKDMLFDLMIWCMVGLLVGGRLGEVFFYNFSYYIQDPLRIISPFDAAGNLVGIYGMSYHGGLIGVLVAALIFVRKKALDFWKLADFVIPAVPAGYFFGRIGNFINGELYGRATDLPWGMYFPSDPTGVLRHPSQIYEALGEGMLLFLVLWAIRNRTDFSGKILPLYLCGYATVRFFLEFWREPELPSGFVFGFLTLGQALSAFMLVAGIGIFMRDRIKELFRAPR